MRIPLTASNVAHRDQVVLARRTDLACPSTSKRLIVVGATTTELDRTVLHARSDDAFVLGRGLNLPNGEAARSAPGLRPFDPQTSTAAIAAPTVSVRSSRMLSELEKQRDALRELVTQAHGMLPLTQCHADSNSSNGDAGSVAARRLSLDAQTMTDGVASLLIAGPSSRTLSDLEERREALQELLAQSKGTPVRVLWSRIQ